MDKYINEQVDNQPLFDEIIDSGDWFKHDMIKGLMGNVVLYLGSSPGTDGERNYAVYLYKLMRGFKQSVEISGKRIHSEIRAGEDYSIIVFKPFLINKKLAPEDEAYLKKFGINLFYVDSANKLKSILDKLNN